MTADYAAAATLYNVVRARFAEPLQFASLTTVTGHDTASASIGLPTIIVGPGRTPAQNLFLFGPNSIGGSEANDFNVAIVDDPQSYAALLRPIDPATIGFFINQGYNSDFIFFLFISRLEVLNGDRAAVGPDGKPEDFSNEPYVFDTIKARFILDSNFRRGFYSVLYRYINEGLTSIVDQTFVPQPGKPAAASRLCFDTSLVNTDVFPTPPPYVASSLCPVSQLQAASNIEAKPKTLLPTAVPSDKTKTIKTIINLELSGSSNNAAKTTGPAWEFTGPRGEKVHIWTRSVFGAYRYLGEILSLREELPKEVLDPTFYFFYPYATTDIIYVTHDLQGCWVSVFYQGRPWCVPTAAIGTKRTFALLHQLFELYAAPSNQPATQTVRVTP